MPRHRAWGSDPAPPSPPSGGQHPPTVEGIEHWLGMVPGTAGFGEVALLTQSINALTSSAEQAAMAVHTCHLHMPTQPLPLSLSSPSSWTTLVTKDS